MPMDKAVDLRQLTKRPNRYPDFDVHSNIASDNFRRRSDRDGWSDFECYQWQGARIFK